MADDEPAPARPDIIEALRAAAAVVEELTSDQIRQLLLSSANVIEDLRSRADKWDAMLATVALDLE